MPAARDNTWKWAFIALLAVAGLLMSPNLQSIALPAAADEQTAAAEAVSGGISVEKKKRKHSHDDADSAEGMDKLLNRVEQQMAGDLESRIEKIEEQMKAHIDSQLDSQLEARVKERLKAVETKLSGTLSSHIDEKLDQVKASHGGDSGASSSVESLRREVDGLIEKKVQDQLDRRIDFRLTKLGIGAKQGRPASAPASPPAPPPPPPSGGDVDEDRGAAEAETPAPKCRGTTIQNGVHKDWCGINDGRKCLDKWETGYMKDHADQLREGLAILHAPGCFPHGTSVASMGYFRTGSTLLYNNARLWLAMGAGEGLVGGFMCPDPTKVGIGTKGAPQEHCVSLCKDHELKANIAAHATVLLMSRRDPFYSVCSRKLMDIWCRMPPSTGPTDWDAIKAYTAKCYATPEMEKEEAVKQCRLLMKMQATIYHARQKAGKTVAHDVLMEDYTLDPKTTIKDIGLALGICREAVTNSALVQFIVDMGKQLKEHPDMSMDITQMHDVHTEEQRRKKCSNLEEWMREDTMCRRWMDNNASALHNGVLKKLIDGRRL